MNEVEKLKLLTGENDERFLELLLSDAQEYALSYTNRAKMVPGLAKPVRDLAVIAYNRRGTEGEAGRSEGGESYSFDAAPKRIYDVLDSYRLVRIGGRTYEDKTEQAETVPPQAGDS